MRRLLQLGREDQRLLILTLLNLGTIALFWPLSRFDFVNFDDPDYVMANGHVLNGLTLDGLKWAFTTTHAGNWHPLTWVSHMLDCQLFGVRSGLHHLTSLWLHVANTVLVFLLLERITGTVWRSGIVAALFSWHPLHVESVAWVSERKDVLSTCFLLLSLLTYARYAQGGGIRHFFVTLGFLVLSLMSKPMAVTAPFLFLLLDFWPLVRWRALPVGDAEEPRRVSSRRLWRLVLEKLPFFTVSAVSILVTLKVQRLAMSSFSDLPLSVRVDNAIGAYFIYLKMTFWPNPLSVLNLYPPPPGINPRLLSVSILVLSGISLVCLLLVRARPYLIVGWAWFLGTLVPVIGLVQVGQQWWADRYTYFPSIGLFLMAVWGLAEAVQRRRETLRWVAAVIAISMTALCLVTLSQLETWRGPVPLWTHAVEVDSQNFVALINLASALDDAGDNNAAMREFDRALAIAPTDPRVLNRFGVFLVRIGRTNDALTPLRRAVALAPGMAEAQNNLGAVLAGKGDPLEALKCYYEALRIDPDYLDAHNNVARLLAAYPDPEFRNGTRALSHASHACEATARQQPQYLDTLAMALAELGRYSEAVAVGEEAQRLAMKLKQQKVQQEIRDHVELFKNSQAFQWGLAPEKLPWE